jgi:hypothetical protein
LTFKNVKKQQTFSEELENVTPILLEENEINIIYHLMQQLLASNKVKIEEFPTQCRHCGRDIMMRNFGFNGWKPYNIKNPKLHRCEPGLAAYKKLNRKKFRVDDNC